MSIPCSRWKNSILSGGGPGSKGRSQVLISQEPGGRCPTQGLESNHTKVFFPNSLPLITLVRHRSRGITCAIESAGAALSQQAFLRQDIAPVNPFSRFRFRHGSCGSLEESRLPLSRPGSVAGAEPIGR
ncbi:hypothetical protein F2Q70_00002925 [Brassica cretica]|uniref:Uncharacterized protein n=1 Tax=Brassica cretica TaxID=69181 RepID=A0A8S9IZZ7_BRACR|nr:hypothetical protein F2Q70_00002925 [Brassica cretica]